jgi:hypothetical protein
MKFLYIELLMFIAGSLEKMKVYFQVVPVDRFYGIVKDKGVGLGIAAVGFTSFSDSPADGTNLTCTGEIKLVADMSTVLRIPW